MRIYPDPVLREKSKPISEFDERVQKIVRYMKQFVHFLGGVGISAPQIGILERVVVADVGGNSLCIANPEIVESKNDMVFEEGCLSIPGISIPAKRPSLIVVRGYDVHGKEIEITLKDLIARVIQHEIDHLEGKLIIDFLKKDELLKFHMNFNPALSAVQEMPPT